MHTQMLTRPKWSYKLILMTSLVDYGQVSFSLHVVKSVSDDYNY